MYILTALSLMEPELTYKCSEVYFTDRKHQTDYKYVARNMFHRHDVEPDCKCMWVKYNTCVGADNFNALIIRKGK